jgi:AraC-like DNA-binding protein
MEQRLGIEQKRQEGSVISGWAVAIDRALENYHLDSESIFKKCGLKLSQTGDANSRFPVIRISRVLREAVKQTGDENFGLIVARFIRATSWHSLGISILASNNIKETLERLIRYRNMFYTELDVEMKEEKEICRLRFSFTPAYRSLLSHTDMDAIIATFILTGRYLSSDGFKPLKINFVRPKPTSTDGFSRLFNCPIEFGANDNDVFFETDQLQQPLPTANSDLALLSDKLTQEYLSRLDQHDIINQVFLKLSETFGREIPCQKRIAESLFMSERTLQRKLHNASGSYQEILDQLRQERAIHYLTQTNKQINEISYYLGFSKIGSFTRAFTRWMGESPNSYRKNQLKES